MDFGTEEMLHFSFCFPWLEEAERIYSFESPSSVLVRVRVRLEENVTESLEKHVTS